MSVELSILGPLEMTRDGQPVDLGGPKQRSLLAYLLLRAPDRVSREMCIEAIWGPDAPDLAVRSLRTYVSNLRRLLGPEVELVSAGDGYQLVVHDAVIDAGLVRKLLVDTDRADPRRRFEMLSKQTRLLSAPPLGGLAERSNLAIEIEGLNLLRTELMVARFEAGLEVGEHRDLLPEIGAAVARSPFDERLTGLLMLALYRAGRQVEALRLCQELRDRLADELGVEPSPELIELERRILTHDPTLSAVQPLTNLRMSSSSFVGRNSELIELAGVMQTAKLISLVGPGGVGKSRLAMEAGRALKHSFEGGVWLCDLATTTQPDALDDVIGAAVGVQPRTGMTRLDAVLEFLRPTSALLLMDNCEHVSARAASAIARLLAGCPALRVLATSRVPLHVEGERVWRVAPLAMPDEETLPTDAATAVGWPAIRLFLDRAPRAFKLTDDRVPVVTRLVQRLDGLPLALELAAARLETMTPEEILTHLSEPGLPELSVAAAQDRHRTLERLVEWSDELLPDELRSVFASLSVFAGDFGVEDVVATCEIDPARTRAALDSLTEWSLLSADTTGSRTRFRLLETMRTYALRQLGAEKIEQLRSRHAQHYATMASQAAAGLNGRHEADAVEVLSHAFTDLRAALHWSIEHDPEQAIRLAHALPDYGYWRQTYEMVGWLTRVLELPGIDQDPRWGALCGAAGRGAWLLGRFREAIALGRLGVGAGASLQVARSGDPGDVVADVALYQGRGMEALDHYRTAMEQARAVDDALRMSWALYYLSVVSTVLGAPDAAKHAEECWAIADELSNPTARSYATYARALVSKHSDPVRSEALFAEAVREARTVSNAWFAGIASMEAASIRAVRSDPDEAIASFAGVIEHWDRVGDRTQMRLAWRYLLRALARGGHDEKAAVLIGALDSVAGEMHRERLARPSPTSVETVRDHMDHDQYVRATVRGSAMSHAEVVEHVRHWTRE